MVSFDEEGKVTANSLASWENERVTISVILYHLDDQMLKDARRKIWSNCRLQINRVVNAADPEHPNNEVLKNAIDDLKKILAPTESLSSVAKACLLQSGYEWAEELVKDIK